MLKQVTIALLFLATTFLMGCGSAGNPPVAQTLTPDLKVMSFNIRYGAADDGDDSWPLRRALVAETIRSFGPHLLGVQECLDFQATFLREALPDHGFVGVGRDDGHQKGEMCGIFYRRAYFDLLDSGHFWLSPTPDQPGSLGWDAALTRMASWAKLRTRGPGAREFIFCNTHFDHVGREARRQSAGVLDRRLRRIAGKLPVILCGDFNADADSALDGPFAVLRRAGWQDTYHGPAQDSGTFNAFRGKTGGPRIDWILTRGEDLRGQGSIVRLGRAGRFPSDHFPVTARIKEVPAPDTGQ